MIKWLSLSDQDRLTTLNQASLKSGIGEKAIEKDWWVTLILKALFEGKYAQYLIFKGGTSLSKGWGLITRFSEDIDIALDPAAFGMKYIDQPNGSQLKRLKRAGCEFTSTLLLQDMNEQLNRLGVPFSAVVIIAEAIEGGHQDKDPQTLYVSFKSLLAPNPYLTDDVKIEVSVRSLKEPNATCSIISLLTTYFPNNDYAELSFTVTAVQPTKTLLEKAFLLCEEYFKPADKGGPRVNRMSRHLSDLVAMARQGIHEIALADDQLYAAIVNHRQNYSRYNWFDYNLLDRSLVTFVPPQNLRNAYQEDYEIMRREMIYNDPPTFDELMIALKKLQALFNYK